MHEIVLASGIADAAESGKSVSASETAEEICSGDDSCDLGLAGGSKSAEMGVRVEVDEHEVDEFGDRFAGKSKSAGLGAPEGEDFSDDKFRSGEEVDFGENKRVKRDLSDGLETGVVVAATV